MKRNSYLPLVIVVIAVILLSGISSLIHRQTNPEDYIKKQKPAKDQKKPKQRTKAYKNPEWIAIVNTSRGDFSFAIYSDDMPITSENFIGLVKKGFYKNLKFHRVEDWVIQAGDPLGDGTGGSGITIQFETIPGLGFDKPYTVGMAREGGDLNSASSQFFITKKIENGLTGKYAAFGRIISGENTIDHIQKGDVIKNITIKRPTGSDIAKVAHMERAPNSSK